MANLLDIRRRIRSVRNTRQITRAMRMVAAAKLRRAQEQALTARAYGDRLAELLAALIAQAPDPASAGDPATERLLRLLAPREPHRLLIIAISSDKGLAGAFNANVAKSVAALAGEAAGAELHFEPVGRKIREYMRRAYPGRLAAEPIEAFTRGVSYEAARTLARRAADAFINGEIDGVWLVGNRFVSVLQQRIERRELLPLAALGRDEQRKEPAQTDPPTVFSFDQPPARVLAALLPRYLETLVYRALLESFAAEHAARMNAMDTASHNAADMIDSLTLNLNRARQAAITKEIIEVVSGAAALEGEAR